VIFGEKMMSTLECQIGERPYTTGSLEMPIYRTSATCPVAQATDEQILLEVISYALSEADRTLQRTIGRLRGTLSRLETSDKKGK
jgi:hypothetical protein